MQLLVGWHTYDEPALDVVACNCTGSALSVSTWSVECGTKIQNDIGHEEHVLLCSCADKPTGRQWRLVHTGLHSQPRLPATRTTTISMKKWVLHKSISIAKETESGTATTTYSNMTTPRRSLEHPSKPQSVCVHLQSANSGLTESAPAPVSPQLRKITVRVDDKSAERGLSVRRGLVGLVYFF